MKPRDPRPPTLATMGHRVQQHCAPASLFWHIDHPRESDIDRSRPEDPRDPRAYAEGLEEAARGMQPLLAKALLRAQSEANIVELVREYAARPGLGEEELPLVGPIIRAIVREDLWRAREYIRSCEHQARWWRARIPPVCTEPADIPDEEVPF